MGMQNKLLILLREIICKPYTMKKKRIQSKNLTRSITKHNIMRIIISIFIISVVFSLASCGPSQKEKEEKAKNDSIATADSIFNTKFVKDVDNNIYPIVKIGKQTWMAENLKVSRFNNGDSIPNINSIKDLDWEKSKSKIACCVYKNNDDNLKKYGRLYNYNTVKDVRSLAPKGWRVPTEKDWEELINFLGGYKLAGLKLKSQDGWSNKNNGSNESGFNGLPGGIWSVSGNGEFTYLSEYGAWWTVTNCDKDHGFYFLLSSKNNELYKSECWQSDPRRCMSVRCIKDEK